MKKYYSYKINRKTMNIFFELDKHNKTFLLLHKILLTLLFYNIHSIDTQDNSDNILHIHNRNNNFH